jgi:hypothetical protein
MVADLILAATVAAQPPPPVVTAPLPPPIVRLASRAQGDIASPSVLPVTAVPVRVRVVAGNRQLFDDTLRVTRNAGASYQESRSEAPEAVCTGDRYYGSQERYSLNINLNLRDETPIGPAVNISVNWQRPSSGVSCGGEGTRTVQLTQTVPLATGQSTTVQGDAGLAVTISR